jgi:AhpD family alkylhydroperoxidase
MARIDLPPGDGGELQRVWSLSPELGAAVGELAGRVGGKGLSLSWRVREAARMRIAHVNGCTICMGWRVPSLARHGVDEELYAHVEDPSAGDYSEQERLAIEYAEKFALDHRSLDDAFFARMKAEFTDVEIFELTVCIGDWIAFGRMTAVLDLDEACAWTPPVTAGPRS